MCQHLNILVSGIFSAMKFFRSNNYFRHIHTNFYHQVESANILKFKLNIHIAEVTILHSDKPSLLYIHRYCISMGCAYKLPRDVWSIRHAGLLVQASRLKQQHYWIFRSSLLCHSVIVWVVPKISKHWGTLKISGIFHLKHSFAPQKTWILMLTDVCDKYHTIFNKDTGRLSYNVTTIRTPQKVSVWQ